MSRATTKADLITSANENYEKLKVMINEMSESEQNAVFDFSTDEKKKEAHWRRDKNLRDILIHLYEWHQMTLKWVPANLNGENRPLLPEPYNWKTYGDLNIVFWQKHQNTSLEEAKHLLDQSHTEIMKLADTFTNEELFSRDTFKWTNGNPLGAFFVSNTGSHYEWAMKKLKACKKIRARYQ